jgi:hypothetical protein
MFIFSSKYIFSNSSLLLIACSIIISSQVFSSKLISENFSLITTSFFIISSSITSDNFTSTVWFFNGVAEASILNSGFITLFIIFSVSGVKCKCASSIIKIILIHSFIVFSIKFGKFLPVSFSLIKIFV